MSRHDVGSTPCKGSERCVPNFALHEQSVFSGAPRQLMSVVEGREVIVNYYKKDSPSDLIPIYQLTFFSTASEHHGIMTQIGPRQPELSRVWVKRDPSL